MNADSVKVKLKNYAKESGRLFQDELVAYCFERTIYRISVSKYSENFTLKGGVFLYAIFEGKFARATRDIDLLSKEIDNSVDVMSNVFKVIFKLEADDAVAYDMSTLSTRTITDFKEYSGINI